jgi:hypothetical protein
MNSDYEKRLEAEIDRELRALPELQAPASLMVRVRSAIAQRTAVPWYRQSWQMWPMVWRVAAMAVLLASFGGLCFASWQLTRAAGFSLAMQEVGHVFSGLTAIWTALNALAGAGLVVMKHLGTGFIIATCAAVVFGYAICVGLGTAVVRLAFARR